MTRVEETRADEDNGGWKLWSTDQLDVDLARVEARRGLFPDSAADASQPGVTLGRYEVLRRIGRGGMGTVFLAQDPALGREVAVKVLHSSASDSGPDQLAKRRRLQREATALGQLTHPNVVRVYDVGEERGHTFIAMEYVSGGTLRDWREYTRPQPDMRSILRTYAEAGRGLAAAHANGLLHRDFKPDNVLVAFDGRVLVSDFGLVRAASVPAQTLAAHEHRPELSEDVTRTGAVLGTPAYMAPEVFAGRAAEAATDQFAFCVSLFEALVGRRPFAGRFPPAKAPWSTFAAAEATSLRLFPRWVRRLLSRGLQPDPRARHPDMDAVVRILEHGMTTRRRRLWSLGGAVGSVSLLSLFFGLGAPDPPVGHPLCSLRDPRATALPVEQHDAIETAFSAANLPDSTRTASVVLSRMDDRAESWAEQLGLACRPDLALSEARRGLQLDCLQAELHNLTALGTVLEGVDAQTAAVSVELLLGRPPALSCQDERALRGRVAPPSDPPSARSVERHRALLAHGMMLTSVGELERARAIAQTVLSSAEAEMYPPLVLEAEFLAARILWKSKRRAQALGALRTLEIKAESQGHDRVALRASMLHLDLLVHEARPPLEFQARLDHARARALRLGDDAALVNVEFTHAEYTRRTGNPEEALRVATAALELARDRLGPKHPEVAYAHDYVNGALVGLDRYSAALEHKRSAIEILEKAYGPDSLAVSVLLNTAGTIARLAGEHVQAQRWHARAIAIVEANLGPHSPRLATGLLAAALSAQARGDADEAVRFLDRQLALQEREGVASHTGRLFRIDALILGRHLESAETAYQEAVRTLASAGSDASAWDRSGTLRAGAQLALLQGEATLAATRASEAIDAAQNDPPGQLLPLIVLAQAQLQQGNLEEGRASLELATASGAASAGTLPSTVAELRVTQLALARATDDPRIEEKRALALASARRAFGLRHPDRRALEKTGG